MPQDTLAQAFRRRYPGAYDDLSDQELEAAVRRRYPGQYDDLPSTDVEQEQAGMSGVSGVIRGAVKGAAGTAVGATTIASKALRSVPVVSAILPTEQGLSEASQRLQPQGMAENVGHGIEQVTELAVPLGLGSKFARLAEIAGMKGPGLLRGALRTLGEAAEMGGKVAAQTSGDPEQIVTASLLGSAVPAVSELAKAAHGAVFQRLPERLYSQIFRLSKDDFELMVRSIAKERQLNPTLARELVERGLWGSDVNMATLAVKKVDQLEDAVMALVKERPTISLPKKEQFVKLLDDLEGQFTGTFFAERGRVAAELKTGLLSGAADEAPTETVLRTKRFLDEMRNTSSFRLDPRLSVKQEELKVAADTARAALKQDRRFAGLMNEERIYIQALDKIVDDAVERNNRKLLNFTDVIIGGGGLASGFPGTGLGVAALVRGFQQPFTLTGIGQGLFRAGKRMPSIAPVARATAGTLGKASGREDRQEDR